MRKIGIILLVVLGIAAIADIGRQGFLYVSQKAAEKVKKAAPPPTAIDVIVQPVDTATMTEVRTYNGNISPMYSVDLAPQISGQITSLTLMRPKAGGGYEESARVSENLEVKKGDILARLDCIGLKADWDKAESDYLKAVKTKELAEKERDRIVGLFNDGSTTEQARDKAVYDYDIAVEDINTKRAIAKQSKWRYNQAFLLAPFDGVVSRVYDKVDLGATVGPGMPVLRLVHLAQLKVIANVPNRYIGQDGITEKVTVADITVEGAEKPVVGIVNKIYKENDRTTRTNPIEIIINNEKGLIRGNMYASVAFHVKTHKDAVRVPADAVIQKGDQAFVFVVENNKAVKKDIETGIWEGPWMEVTKGLKGNETLVVGGQTKLTDGSEVNVVQHLEAGALRAAAPKE